MDRGGKNTKISEKNIGKKYRKKNIGEKNIGKKI
jgi:hypothetical protein